MRWGLQSEKVFNIHEKHRIFKGPASGRFQGLVAAAGVVSRVAVGQHR